ncbi:MAG: M14 family metallopeptidase [Lentimicrobiaceae bacterium]|nr:M14 family metallopeptidase [Lentimicrobiaceae bacterium]
MKKSITILFLSFLYFLGFSQNPIWDTYYEKSGCTETPRYDETIKYCKQLVDYSPLIHYDIFGKSPQGRDIPALIIDKNKNFTPETVRNSGNAVVLIQACVHPGEPDGKDAGLMLIRDLVINNKYPGLLDHLTILFIPIFNVDGHERFGPYNRINQDGPKEMGWRVTAQNLNLNRDYMKADAPEMKAWLKLFNRWLPDFTVDCHVTDGADYQYVLTYGLELYGNMDAKLTAWTKDVYLQSVEKKMEEAKLPMFPYVSFREWHDPRSGLVVNVAPPMLCGGYCAIQNRPCLLIETHMLKDYKTRVEATYELLKQTALLLNKEYKSLIKLTKEADRNTVSETFRNKYFPVAFRESFADSTQVSFKGVQYEAVKSDLSGGLWFQYDKTKPETFMITMFNHPVVEDSVLLPAAYILPPEWISIIELLGIHSIDYKILKAPTKIKITAYRFKNPKWSEKPYESRHRLEVNYDATEEERMFPAGSVVVKTDQRSAKVIAHFFEPKAFDSFISWGFMDAIFEQKEYGETYVLEVLARKMLAENLDLKNEFEEKMKNEPEFAKDSWGILNWFYSKSPYWDRAVNKYPVGKIVSSEVLQSLPVE